MLYNKHDFSLQKITELYIYFKLFYNNMTYSGFLSDSLISIAGTCLIFSNSLGFNTAKSKSVPPSSFITTESKR